ncbi:MAG: transporter substrate-binding domain-containing protein [Pseudoalteromonas sp.]|nr:transporter substrate-binding domain-containing protein [Pseudoalteromonas sp.]
MQPALKRLILICILTLSSHVNADSSLNTQILRVAFVDVPPLSYADLNGVPKGSLIKKFRAICEMLNLEPEFVYVPHKRLLKTIESGAVHMWAGQKKSRVNTEIALTSKNPVINMSLNVYWKKGGPAVSKWDDLSNKNLILISSYSYGGKHRALEKGSLSTRFVISHEQGFDVLSSDKQQYLLGYESISNEIINRFHVEDVKSATLGQFDLYIKVHKDTPNSDIIIEKVNDILSSGMQ